MSHNARMLGEAFNAAKRFSQREKLEALKKLRVAAATAAKPKCRRQKIAGCVTGSIRQNS